MAIRTVRILLYFALVTPAMSPAHAADGDTLIVRTFTFDSISTRRATFAFPDDGRKWARVLMRYTLQCDSATTGDSYPCGEWDVNTYTYVRKHTGVYDSTRHTQPYFVVDGESPDRFEYSTEPRYHYVTRWSDPSAGKKGERAPDDWYMCFDGYDYLEVPPEAVQGLDSAFTISMWVKGDPAKQPQNDHLLEATDRGGRVLSIHLPWGTGEVYFEAGGRLQGNNNRLVKMAEPGDYKGRWNHWAFTKDVASGLQRIYVNGKLWHEAGNMTKPIEAIDRFTLGANASGSGGFYAGCIDDIRIWDVALDEQTISEWRFKLIDTSHPEYEHLKVSYDFQIPQGAKMEGPSPIGHFPRMIGQPQPYRYGMFQNSDARPSPDAVLVTDREPASQITVRRYEDPENPMRMTSMSNVWPAYDSYFDARGNLIEQRRIDSPAVMQNGEHVYYGEPFEVLEPYELGRFITPYGKRLELGDDGFTWVYDVTDYAPLLRGAVDLQAANDFELLDLQFVFIEGTPPRDVMAIENVWEGGSYNYGKLADNEQLKPVRLALDPAGAGFMLRSRISGHGHYGPDNCCEWDAKEHAVWIDGEQRFAWTIWRNCGLNPVYPQGGTWQFDRAGWCPGTWVDTYDHELTPFGAPGGSITLDYAIEPYAAEGGEEGGSYVMEHQLFTYGPPNFRRDAAIREIIAPSDRDEFRRHNPVSGSPVVVIANLGADSLRRLHIQYGLVGGNRRSFEWTGALGFLEADTVRLPKPDWTGMAKGARFAVAVERPNGKNDENTVNDRMIVGVVEPYIFPERFVVHLNTPGFGRAADNAFAIVDAMGDTAAARSEFADDTRYAEMITLDPGAYEFRFVDREEDGMIRHWWLRGSEPEKIGENGLLQIQDADGNVLVDLGYDFAEGEVVRFFVGAPR